MRHDRIDPAQPEYIGKAHAVDVDTGDADAVVRERTERSAPVIAADRGDPWSAIKSRFVDDPAGAVADAEQLVREAVEERIRELQDEAAAVYAHDGDDSSTEALRNRLIRYQAYCGRLAGSALH